MKLEDYNEETFDLAREYEVISCLKEMCGRWQFDYCNLSTRLDDTESKLKFIMKHLLGIFEEYEKIEEATDEGYHCVNEGRDKRGQRGL